MQHFVSYKTEINDFLISFLKKKRRELKNSHFSEDVLERLTPLVTAGKMLRGSLLINTYEKLSGQNYSLAALQAAAALELAGTSFLIHDDIIDQDELRRSQETLHFQYRKLGEKKKYSNPQHFGESLAICIGDIVFFLVYELLPSDLIKLFSQQLSLTALGEMHDVELALMNGEKTTKDDILQMYLDKTSSYTTSLPLMAGAILSKQNKKTIVQLNELGKTLGLIFQIKDDELGLFGDKSKTGKPVGADIREGKKTLYYYYLLKNAKDKEKLMQIFSNCDISEAKIIEVLDLMNNYQIRELVNNNLKKLELQAKEKINQLQVMAETEKMLKEFLNINLMRVR